MLTNFELDLDKGEKEQVLLRSLHLGDSRTKLGFSIPPHSRVSRSAPRL